MQRARSQSKGFVLLLGWVTDLPMCAGVSEG